jgi:hypothetical protein
MPRHHALQHLINSIYITAQGIRVSSRSGHSTPRSCTVAAASLEAAEEVRLLQRLLSVSVVSLYLPGAILVSKERPCRCA